MRTISVLNMKGGVGKTTTSLHIAAGLAGRGSRVLLIDADPQGNISHTLNLRHEATLRELMLGEASIDDVVLRGARENLDVIVPGRASHAGESFDERDSRNAGPPEFRSAVPVPCLSPRVSGSAWT